jgi:hypothetical protein
MLITALVLSGVAALVAGSAKVASRHSLGSDIKANSQDEVKLLLSPSEWKTLEEGSGDEVRRVVVRGFRKHALASAAEKSLRSE